jgi:hypothetical protein
MSLFWRVVLHICSFSAGADKTQAMYQNNGHESVQRLNGAPPTQVLHGDAGIDQVHALQGFAQRFVVMLDWAIAVTEWQLVVVVGFLPVVHWTNSVHPHYDFFIRFVL